MCIACSALCAIDEGLNIINNKVDPQALASILVRKFD
jgi:hypothetical protein